MTMNRIFRITMAAVLGAAAGFSFTSTVLPTLVSSAGLMDEMFAQLALSPRGNLASMVAMVWAVAGGLVCRFGSRKTGSLLLGVVGLASGIFIGSSALGGGASMVLVAALGGATYGAVGGLLLGTVFRKDGAP